MWNFLLYFVMEDQNEEVIAHEEEIFEEGQMEGEVNFLSNISYRQKRIRFSLCYRTTSLLTY